MLESKILAEIIFGFTYLGIAFGTIPGLAIDRTGITILGATAMIATGLATPVEAAHYIDVSTMLLLYGLMVLSAQLSIGGFYTRVAFSIVKRMKKPKLFLLQLMMVSAVFSAILANDIVCLAFTPVISVSMIRAGYNPIPFLLGLVMSSNIGSAATIIGNPQNMLIGQAGRLHFGRFILWCAPPSLIALFVCYLILLLIYRNKWKLAVSRSINFSAPIGPEFNIYHSMKGIILTVVLIVMFFTSVPREIAALGVAGILLCSRDFTTRQLLERVDWHLILLFAGLFVIVGVISKYGIPDEIIVFLNSKGLNINNPLVLIPSTVLLCNIFSNVPAVMLLLKNITFHNVENLYLLALISTYSGNMITIGSLANLITIEQASQFGIKVSFKEYARAGIPVCIASVLVVIVWRALLSGP